MEEKQFIHDIVAERQISLPESTGLYGIMRSLVIRKIRVRKRSRRF